jgi:hypothetical protein
MVIEKRGSEAERTISDSPIFNSPYTPATSAAAAYSCFYPYLSQVVCAAHLRPRHHLRWRSGSLRSALLSRFKTYPLPTLIGVSDSGD